MGIHHHENKPVGRIYFTISKHQRNQKETKQSSKIVSGCHHVRNYVLCHCFGGKKFFGVTALAGVFPSGGTEVPDKQEFDALKDAWGEPTGSWCGCLRDQ